MNCIESIEAPKTTTASRSWVANLIAPNTDEGVGTRASFVSCNFSLSDVELPVRLYISAQGLYRAFVNGKRVGHDVLTPGLTCYDDRIAYQSYEVTSLVQAGLNRIEIWLADGWFRSSIMWGAKQIQNCWGDRIAAIAEIEQGGSVVAKTDCDWKSGFLPISKAGIYYGEDYDARLEKLLEIAGVEPIRFDTGILVPHEAAAVVELEPLPPVENWPDDTGRLIFDFGQNAAGYVRITVSGAAGTVVRIEHSEVLGPDRSFANHNYRSARSEIRYTLKGEGIETYQPHFTYMGFRYARISIEGTGALGEVVSVPISSIPNVAGGVTTGNETVNRLVLNTIWSLRANFIEIPTDCPQRDERLGWTGDAQVFAGTAAWLGDVEKFLKKYLRDVIHDQRGNGAIAHFSPDPTRLHPDKFDGDWAGSTGWGDAIVLIPWQLYLHYGDTSALRESFPAMLKWLDYLWNISGGPVIQPNGNWGGAGFTFGDWLQPTGSTVKPRPTIGEDCAATLYHFISTDLTAKIATIIGECAEADRLHSRAVEIRAAFVNEYFSPAGRLAHNDQTSYSLAFLYDLVPAEYFEAAKSYFRKIIEDANYLIGTGFIGTPALLPALSKLGMADLAQKVFLNRKAPGWLYQVERGATSIWERWDAMGPEGEIYDPEMNSYNHYAYGAVCQWLFENVAGLSPTADAPGFKRVLLNPSILPELSPVSVWHETRQGLLKAAWSVENGVVTYDIELPEGSFGVLMSNPKHTNFRVDGSPIAIGEAGYPVSNGRHTISFSLVV